MAELLTAAQMRAIEQAAISAGEATGLELMERAGQGVVSAILEEWPEMAGDRAEVAAGSAAEKGGLAPRPAATPQSNSGSLKAVVLCGPGNNGGDGFVVARLLAARGWAVEVFLYGDPKKLPPDARVNYERCPVPVRINENWWPVACEMETTQQILLIDAIFGTGRLRQPEGVLYEALCPLANSATEDRFKVVSVDIASGLCADSGRMVLRFHGPHEVETEFAESQYGLAVEADLTVTFHAMKLGHVLAWGPHHNRKVECCDIGLERKALGWGEVLSFELVQVPPVAPMQRGDDPNDSVAWRLDKYSFGHKFSHGHALVLTGGLGKTGAARLAARGALRIGAGLVTLGVPPAAQMEVAAQITALMLTRVPDAAGLAAVLEDARINALCLGPGLGLERPRDLVPVALAAELPTVLDADALSAYAEDPQVLWGMLHENCVLTPHGGEFSRLFPDIAAKLAAPTSQGPAYSKVDATRDAAKRAGCTVLFKGADTVIADPSGRCSVNAAVYSRSASWLATAGSGDVLAGFITGLLARGFTPHQAAATAAYLHVEAALEFGPGLIAEDLPETLPKVLRKVMAG